jgi:hypothetical protein
VSTAPRARQRTLSNTLPLLPPPAGAVHPFFFSCQYHPEFQSHPHKPSPPFHGLLLAASGQLTGKLPLPPTVRRKPSVALSQPTSPLRGPESGAASGKPPTSGPASASMAALVFASSATPSTQASPARPVRQADTTAMPPAGTLSGIAPA